MSRRPTRRPGAPLSYRIANFLTCNVGAWVVLLGIASIEARPLRLLFAGVAALAGLFIGLGFNRIVDKAIYDAARAEVEAMLRELEEPVVQARAMAAD